MRFIDLTGQRFGKLTVIGVSPEKTLQNRLKWECVCDCGRDAIVTGMHLKDGKTNSCGCLRESKNPKE